MASQIVATRDETWRRRKCERLACERNHSWISVAPAAAAVVPSSVLSAALGEIGISTSESGTVIQATMPATADTFAASTCRGTSGAVSISSLASSPEMVSHARPPASWPTAMTTTGTTTNRTDRSSP